MLSDLIRAMELIDKFKTSKVEIWIMKFWAPVPGQAGLMFPANGRGFLPETERIFAIPEVVFDQFRADIVKSGIPTFYSSGKRAI